MKLRLRLEVRSAGAESACQRLGLVGMKNKNR